MSKTRENRIFRHRRIRKKIFGTNEKPRFSIFRSNQHMYLQLIDDLGGKTLVSVDDRSMQKKGAKRIEKAEMLGARLASMAKEKSITRVVFDRSGYAYHGMVKTIAESARKEGLLF